MKSPLIVTKEAEEDLAEARSWYHRQRDGLDEEFVLCVEEALDRISRMPEAAEEVYPGVRQVIVRRFPYGVYYKVESTYVAVIAVYHSKRDPRGWQDRAHRE